MSTKENTVFLEKSREAVLGLVEREDWLGARSIAINLKEMGFEEQFISIWENDLSDEQREKFLVWFDNNKTHGKSI